MSTPSINLRITGKNSDGEYWLHIDGSPQKAGLNLGDPMGMITSALLMAASGHTYTRTDAILSDPRVKALVEAATPYVSTVQTADYARQLRQHEALVSALASLKGYHK